MPRPGPARILVAIRLSASGIAALDARAAAETAANRSELVRRMVAFASAHMPAGWKPS